MPEPREDFTGDPPVDWTAARLQRNRCLLVLSFAGIALLVILLVAVGPVSGFELLLASLGCVSFFAALVAGTAGMGARPGRRDAPARFDAVLVTGFLFGVALCMLLGIAAGLAVLQQADEDTLDSEGTYETSALVVHPNDVLAGTFGPETRRWT
jgi:hypothetical protein